MPVFAGSQEVSQPDTNWIRSYFNSRKWQQYRPSELILMLYRQQFHTAEIGTFKQRENEKQYATVKKDPPVGIEPYKGRMSKPSTEQSRTSKR